MATCASRRHQHLRGEHVESSKRPTSGCLCNGSLVLSMGKAPALNLSSPYNIEKSKAMMNNLEGALQTTGELILLTPQVFDEPWGWRVVTAPPPPPPYPLPFYTFVVDQGRLKDFFHLTISSYLAQ